MGSHHGTLIHQIPQARVIHVCDLRLIWVQINRCMSSIHISHCFKFWWQDHSRMSDIVLLQNKQLSRNVSFNGLNLLSARGFLGPVELCHKSESSPSSINRPRVPEQFRCALEPEARTTRTQQWTDFSVTSWSLFIFSPYCSF